MVRPSPPRFLNFGDTFELPVVVQNQTDAPMTVRARGARDATRRSTDGAGREVTVPANDRVEVRFPAAAELAGTARFQIVGDRRGSAERRRRARAAGVDAGDHRGVRDLRRDRRRRRDRAAGRAARQGGDRSSAGSRSRPRRPTSQALTDAMLYLVHYPFECAEQRVVADPRDRGAASDVLAAFKTKDMPSARGDGGQRRRRRRAPVADAELRRRVRVLGSRPPDRCRTSRSTSRTRSARAQAKGFAVPPAMLDRARSRTCATSRATTRAYYPQDVRWAISAYALYTRKQLGDLDIAKGQQLIAEAGGVDKLPMEADGWLLGAVRAATPAAAGERKAIVRHALNQVSRDRGRGELHDQLRRRQLPAPGERPPRRRA